MQTTVVNKAKAPVSTFPCLMEELAFPNTIVLITQRNCDGTYCGIVVASDVRDIGYIYDSWRKETLVPFVGTVTLEQE